MIGSFVREILAVSSNIVFAVLLRSEVGDQGARTISRYLDSFSLAMAAETSPLKVKIA